MGNEVQPQAAARATVPRKSTSAGPSSSAPAQSILPSARLRDSGMPQYESTAQPQASAASTQSVTRMSPVRWRRGPARA